jgi:hypothetical protein
MRGVSYVSSRSDLPRKSVFSAFYCFRSAFEGRRGWLVGGTICFFLALGSKETAAMFPFVLLASDVLLGSRSSWRSRIWRVHVPLLSVVLLAGGIRVWRYVTLEQSGVGALFTGPM